MIHKTFTSKWHYYKMENYAVVKQLYLQKYAQHLSSRKKKPSYKIVHIVWHSLRYTKNKRTVQKTVDKNVNAAYLTGLGGFSFPPLQMAWTVTKSTHYFHNQNFIWPKQKVSAWVIEIGHLDRGVTSGLLNFIQNPSVGSPCLSLPTSPLLLASPSTLGLDRKPQTQMYRAWRTYFQHGLRTEDNWFFKEGGQLLKRTVDPSLKDEEAIFHRKVKKTAVLPADCGPYSLVHLKTDRCTTLG